jgi:hypothetical protein
MIKSSQDTVEQVIDNYSSNLIFGLTNNQIISLRKQYGYNKFEKEVKVLYVICMYECMMYAFV